MVTLAVDIGYEMCLMKREGGGVLCNYAAIMQLRIEMQLYSQPEPSNQPPPPNDEISNCASQPRPTVLCFARAKE